MHLFYNQFIDPLLNVKDSQALAFHIGKRDFSYSQFYDVVEQVYAKVINLPEDNICLYATDDIRTYASIIALWYAGKAYVPLNPNQPKERHVEVVASVGAHYILSADEEYGIGIEGINHIYTNSIVTDEYVRSDEMKVIDVPDSSLAYILFTSGSTGKPKGVQITRGDLAAFIDSMDNIGLDITDKDRCLQPFDLTFDFSVSSYVIPLAKGASIYTIPNKATKFTYIAELLEEHHLTVLQMVPSMIRNLLPYMDEVDVSSVRYNILCGDKTNIENLLAANDIVSIGKTFKNSGVLLIGDDNAIINTPNVEGELCLCGEQLTPGYWKNDKENAEKFFEKDGVRYYRTGDLCYYAEDVNLMYVSRKDFQVKINGFRVELGEIENRYAAVSGGKYSVVIPYLNEQGNTELAIVIEGKEYDVKEHRAALANALPAYEVPSSWLFIRNIPLNQNGKVDRKAIKEKFNLK